MRDIEILEKILNDKANRINNICKFQMGIWENESINDETLYDILDELCSDLDLYEPCEEWRKEDPSYYGDEKLEEIVKTAIHKIQSLLKVKG